MENELLKRSRVLADQFLNFVNASKSPFHVIEWCKQHLIQHGYHELVQTSPVWKLEKGSKYFLTRNNSTIMAFNIGDSFAPETTGFKVIGAHSDSPCLRLTPNSKNNFKDLSTCHVSTYGGGLWHTWFDRDLVLAGRVAYKNGQKLTSKLWQSSRPLMKIPNLAIHLTDRSTKFDPNTETHLKPIISSNTHTALLSEQLKKEANIFNKHDAGIIKLLCQQTKIAPQSIIDFDLYFSDSQKSSYFGVNQDFISSPRLDNLFSTFHAMVALTSVQNKGNFVNVAVAFDHEECGSSSAQGADSPLLPSNLQTIYQCICSKDYSFSNYQKAILRSMLLSADMAHAIHPNYSEKHQSNHQVQMNKGVVIKTNYNQRYATDLVSSSLLKVIAQKKGVPIQEFVVKNDSPCGSTIGPIIASGTGIKTIDLGVAMLGMHSIRQTCGILDGVYYQDLFSSFYENFQKIDHNLLDS